jgi:hypothetical protein
MPQVSGPQAATVESASTSRSSSRVREGSRSRDLSEGAGEETIAASSASRLSTSQSSDSRVRLGPLTLTLQKVTPYIGYRHVLMAIATLQILFLCMYQPTPYSANQIANSLICSASPERMHYPGSTQPPPRLLQTRLSVVEQSHDEPDSAYVYNGLG